MIRRPAQLTFFWWSAGGLIGFVEALILQNPIQTFWLNSDRSVYFYAFISYSLIVFFLSLLLPSMKRSLVTRFVSLTGIAVLILSALYAFIPPYRFLQTKSVGPMQNVLLITLDTVRADHVSCYGYAKKTTPFLDTIAARGVRFDQAYTNATWTLPSHASLFTGQMPSVHGVGYSNFFVSPTLITLAEKLKSRGYMTAAFTGGPFLASVFNIHQGFDYYDERLDPNSKLKRITLFRLTSKILKRPLWRTDGQRRSDEINEGVFEYLNWASKRQPFFLFVNYFDAHEPYDPPESARQALSIHTRMKGNIRFYPLNKQNGIATHQNGKPLSADDFQQLKNLYDGDIRFQDEQFSRLWKKLEELKLANNTLVIITSDHGETIGEHGFLDHGHNLFQEQVKVPLIIYDAVRWQGNKTLEMPVQLIDVMPTVLETLSIRNDVKVQGKSLLALLNGAGSETRPVLAEIDADIHPRFAAFRRSQKMMLEDWLKYVESSDSKHFLFDLRHGEEQNLIQQSPEAAEKMSGDLRSIFQALESLQHKGSGKMDEETREKLKALGYIE